MELEEKYEKEKGYSAKENYTEGLWNGNYTDEYVEWLEDLVEKSNDIHNVSGICKSIRVSDSECLSDCGNKYEPRLGFKYCPYCGKEVELIF